MRDPTPIVMALLTLALLGCQPTGRAGELGRPAALRSTASAAKPDKGASSHLAASVSPTPAPAGTLAQVLGRPSSGTIAVAGRVTLDARYAVGQGSGALLTLGGVEAVGLDGAAILSNNGAGLISDAGGAFVSKTRGAVGLISDQGGSLISDHGGGLISDHGGGVVSNNGGGIISNNGGSFVSKTRGLVEGQALLDAAGHVVAAAVGTMIVPAGLVAHDGTTLVGRDGSTLIGHDPGAAGPAGPAGYRLAQAAALPAFGRTLPAAGMWVTAIDLRTGLAVPLGLNDARQPVYTVYSNETGGFEVYLPADVAPFARFVARAPGSASDPRLALHVLTAGPRGADGEVRIDENAAAVTAYVRMLIASIFVVAAQQDEAAAIAYAEGGSAFGPAGQLAIRPVSQKIYAALREIGADRWPEARQYELGLLLADRLIAEYPALGTVPCSDAGGEWLDPASAALTQVPAFGALVDLFASVHEKVAEQVRGVGDPVAHFAAKPYLRAANAGSPPAPCVRIAKGSDLSELIVRRYMARFDLRGLQAASHVFADLGLGAGAQDRVRAGGQALSYALGMHLFLGTARDDQGVEVPTSDVLVAAMRHLGPALATAPPPPIVPLGACGEPSTPPAAPAFSSVVTVAGVAPGEPASPGRVDGPGPVARFEVPGALALDPAAEPPVAYVVDLPAPGAPGVIRRVALDAQGLASVTTLQGATPEVGTRLARLSPVSLVADEARHLYLLDYPTQGVWRLTLDPAGDVAACDLIAGGTAGFQDGAGVQARFDNAIGVALDGQGGLLVADGKNHRLRRVELADPAHQVTTLLGARGLRASLDAARAQEAAIAMPSGVVRAPDGTVYLLDFEARTLRAIAAPGGASSPTHFVAGGETNEDAPNGFGTNATLAGLLLAFDPTRDLLVFADSRAPRVRMATPAGDVFTVAGTREAAYVNGSLAEARFHSPLAVEVDRTGALWVTDAGNHVVRRILP